MKDSCRAFEFPYGVGSYLSVRRRNLIKYFEENGFYLLREGGRHSIYTNDQRTIPVKRHHTIDRVTANQLCKQAGLRPKF